MRLKLNNYGFTLVELLVVISVIGLLSTLAIIALNDSRMKSRDVARKSDLRQMQKALELYYADNQNYPQTFSGLPGSVPIVSASAWHGDCDYYNNSGTYGLSGPNGYIANISPKYIGKLPLDPKGRNVGSDRGCYLYASNGIDYKILAHMTPESGYVSSDSFFDPQRPGGGGFYAWQISTAGAKDW